MRLYDYVDARGVNRIGVWTRTLPLRERAKLNNKLSLLEQAGPDLLPGLLAGPNIQGQRHIYKLKIGSSGSGRALRPLACRGPIDNEEELTLLVGAEEHDGKLPKNAARAAEERRQEILANPTQRRCSHEWVA
jgi:hypothetical protein